MPRSETKTYVVTFRESMIVYESVEASSKADAIRRVKGGEGECLDQLLDEVRGPTAHRAEVGECPDCRGVDLSYQDTENGTAVSCLCGWNNKKESRS